MRSWRLWMFGLFLLPVVTGRLEAVVLYGSGDPAYNTEPPGGALAGSGWQYQGFWNDFLGTPVAPRLFLSAGHVGGKPGDAFLFQNNRFTAVASYDDPQSDLVLWEVSQPFPLYAPLYEKPDEPGKLAVVFGRGTLRGEPIEPGSSPGRVQGWLWGSVDHRMRWGQNRIEKVVAGDNNPDLENFPMKVSDLLQATFDGDDGPDEAHLTVGDSGGGLFIQDGLTWKLAGIHLAADGTYSAIPEGDGFAAALFDQRGFYKDIKGGKVWNYIHDHGSLEPGAFYSTRVSSRMAWIRDVTRMVEFNQPLLQVSDNPSGPFEADQTAGHDPNQKFFAVPKGNSSRFFRIMWKAPISFERVGENPTQLIFYYQ